MKAEDCRFLAAMLCSRAGEHTTELSDQRPPGPQASRCVQEGAHLTAHVSETGGCAEDDCIGCNQFIRSTDRDVGKGLLRVFILFEALFPRELLPGIKLRTNEIESAFSENRRRSVNIDPGYISLENVILATTKGNNHRVYLGSGIYADLTLTYSSGTYRPLEWTYPDYGEGKTIPGIKDWRENYKQVLRCQKA